MELKIALLPGDGIGPEIIEQAVGVLGAVEAKYGHKFSYTKALVGACAIDATGNPYPDETHQVCLDSDVVLFGAIGDPKYDNNPTSKVRPEQGLLAMRKKLGLFANLRPIQLFASLADRSPLKKEVVEGADFLCVRELTSGMYFGEPQGRDEANTYAVDTCKYTREEIERIVRLAFELAGKRRGHLTVVDKANVLETSRLWREVAQGIAPEYPEIKLDYMFVDNAAMQIIRQPTYFDVVVTENMFGDILTDEASVISGSLGMLPSASLGFGIACNQQLRAGNDLDLVAGGQCLDVGKFVIRITGIGNVEVAAGVIGHGAGFYAVIIGSDRGHYRAAGAFVVEFHTELVAVVERYFHDQNLQQHLGRNRIQPGKQRLHDPVDPGRGTDHQTVVDTICKNSYRSGEYIALH